MPKGDGTGPFGNGPLNRSGRGSGKGMGRRQGLNRQSECPRGDNRRNPVSFSSGSMLTGRVLGGALKLLGMAVMAVPAMLKARKQLQLPDSDGEQPVIEIKPEPVEDEDSERQ